MKTLTVILMLLGAMLIVSSCNMFRGAGEDIEDAGDAIKDATN